LQLADSGQAIEIGERFSPPDVTQNVVNGLCAAGNGDTVGVNVNVPDLGSAVFGRYSILGHEFQVLLPAADGNPAVCPRLDETGGAFSKAAVAIVNQNPECVFFYHNFKPPIEIGV
jgi:hypothetical protein